MTTMKGLLAAVETEAEAQGISFDAELERTVKALVRDRVRLMATMMGLQRATVLSHYGHHFAPADLLRDALAFAPE
jgi:hypothetical protein